MAGGNRICTDGGFTCRSENRAALRDFFEVDAKFVVLSTLGALAKDGKVEKAVVEKAIKDLGINTEKPNPANS